MQKNNAEGLTSLAAEKRLKTYGPNILPEKDMLFGIVLNGIIIVYDHFLGGVKQCVCKWAMKR